MRFGPSILGILLVLLVPAAVAEARAPTLEELPTVKLVTEQAEKLIAENRAKEIAAMKDPKMDLIKDYAELRVSSHNYVEVVNLLADDKEEMKYRRDAGKALISHFEDLDPWDDRIQRIKSRVGLDLYRRNLLHNGTLEIRILVARVLQAYWPGKYSQFGYDPEETSYTKRNKAVKKWKEFLTQR